MWRCGKLPVRALLGHWMVGPNHFYIVIVIDAYWVRSDNAVRARQVYFGIGLWS
jgi:hypothetical protein